MQKDIGHVYVIIFVEAKHVIPYRFVQFAEDINAMLHKIAWNNL